MRFLFFIFYLFSFVWPTSEIRDTCTCTCMYTQLLEPDQISHTQSMVAKRGLTIWANVDTPM